MASALAAFALCACQSVPDNPPRATAQLAPTAGNKAFGEATFEQVGDKVRVAIFVQGLQPGQEHGLHVHEVGDCGNGAKNAKDHFNPHGKRHGSPQGAERHAGDLPALAADKQGRAKAQADVDLISLGAGPNSIVGRALVVHAKPDDYTTQPSGGSGDRIACGVIRSG
jgi:Cu-Zn family superoxide dismutase